MALSTISEVSPKEVHPSVLTKLVCRCGFEFPGFLDLPNPDGAVEITDPVLKNTVYNLYLLLTVAFFFCTSIGFFVHTIFICNQLRYPAH